MMNFISYLDEVARRFVSIIEEQQGAKPMPTDDFGWENHRFSGDRFRMAHVEIFNQDRFMVVHCCVFPHVHDPSPIFGFDVIAGESKVTGLFMDLSPTTHDKTPAFSDLHLTISRNRPDWGRIFSENWIACRPDESELIAICDMATATLQKYLAALGQTRDTNAMMAEMQDRYCIQQRRNEHTVKAIRNLLGEQRAREFINTVLFPTVDVTTTLASYRDPRYPALMSSHDVQVLARLAKTIPVDGVAVECGSALGGSAMVMLEANPMLGQLHLIDSEWRNDGDPLDHELLLYHRHVIDLHLAWPLHEFTSSYDFAAWYLGDHAKVTMHRLESPYALDDWQQAVDLVYEDSSHANPQLRDNLEFWWQRLKPGGILAGHDYGKNCRDVDATVHDLADQWGVSLKHESAIWWVSKPS